MSSYDQQQSPSVYPPAVQAYPSPAYAVPPPAGYPVKDEEQQTDFKPESKSRGDGFWEGWCYVLFPAVLPCVAVAFSTVASEVPRWISHPEYL